MPSSSPPAATDWEIVAVQDVESESGVAATLNNADNAGLGRLQERVGYLMEHLTSRIQTSRLSYFFTSGGSNDARTPDFYKLLDVSRDANEAEIQRAYYKMALSKHTDKGGDNAFMQELNEAKRVLLDPILKQAYDRGGIPAVRAAEQRKPDKYVKGILKINLLIKIMATIPDIMCRDRFNNELKDKYPVLVEAVQMARMHEDEDHSLPEDLTSFLRIRGYGFLVRAIEAALAQKFVCIQCNRKIVDGILGLCYCEQEAPHCLMACCGEEKQQEEETVGWSELLFDGLHAVRNKMPSVPSLIACIVVLLLIGFIVHELEKDAGTNSNATQICAAEC